MAVSWLPMDNREAVTSIRRFNRFYTALIGVLNRRILRSPYSLTEVRILYEISRDDGGNARKLIRTLAIDEGYLSRTIDSLFRRGLLTRRQSREDGRVFHLSLSAAGRSEMRKLEEAAAAEIDGIISPLSPSEVEEVVFAMTRIQALLGGGGTP
jgi:DNA-binding MarR family transcriptional regulator